MPHRVTALFRSRSNSFGPTVLDSKKKTSAALSALAAGKSALRDRAVASSSSSSFSILSSADSVVSMPDAHKRLSLVGPTPAPQHPAAKLSVQMESPPLVFYGPPARSSGALLSGQLRLVVTDDMLAIESFRMVFAMVQKMKRPFHGHCAECANRTTELGSWNFLQSSTPLQHGMYYAPVTKILYIFAHMLSLRILVVFN